MPASVPFAGRYRLIDFILSSMVNAGMTDVGVAIQGNYQSLLDHLGSGKDWDLSRKHGGLRLLPAFADDNVVGGIREYRGKLEALAGVRSYLEGIRQKLPYLAGLGVEMIPALGETFDPNRHNAVMHCDDPEAGENTIVEVFQQGFACGDKVIRFSMVRVAN